MSHHKPLLLTSLLCMAGVMPLAHAHISLQTPSAAVGSSYQAVLRIGHGCQGSDTTRIRVRIPDGVLAVKPQPKAGWVLTLTDGPYTQPETLHGASIDHGVREIDWTGMLPDAYFDDFSFVATLSPSLKPGDTLYFPVVQECTQGVSRWIDTSGNKKADNPAPSLKLTAPQPKGGHHSH
ncbi:YcnI family protein [Castellaniella sp.]|uniref:YcnI family protein n=1 Tax=Castellaniella sp. TaxID=1955812 RepID=UPI002AFF480D|nr:YcnI family protein [Castellaniella sp.]